MTYSPKFITISAFAVAMVPLLYLIGHGLFMYAAIVVGVVIFLTINRNLEMWWMIAIAMQANGLNLGLPASIDWSFMSMWAFFGFSVLTKAILRKDDYKLIVIRRLAFALLLVVFLTASIRGWGLRILGSDNWGGMQYLFLIGSLGFYILSQNLRLTEKQIRKTVKWLFILTFLPAVISLITHFIPPLGFLGTIFSVSEEAELQATERVISRYQALEFPAIWAGVLGLLYFEQRKKISLPMALALGASFVMMGLSGHRTVMVMLGLTYLIYFLIRWRQIPMNNRMQLAAVVIVGIPLLYGTAHRLPLSFQRAASVLPGIHVAEIASHDAEGTSEWRVEMWKEVIPMIPDYLLVGKGLGFTLDEAYSAFISKSDVQSRHKFFIATHQYHNGPLWLIMDLGLVGFLLGVSFMIMAIKYYGRKRISLPKGSWKESTYITFFIFLIAKSIFFFVVIGGPSQFTSILLLLSLLDSIARSASAQPEIKAPASAII